MSSVWLLSNRWRPVGAGVVDDDGGVRGCGGEGGDRIGIGDVGDDADHARIGMNLQLPCGGVHLGGAALQQLFDEGLAEPTMTSRNDGDGSFG